MEHQQARFTSIDAYIATFPDDIQVHLAAVRAAISAAAPEATECISYQMPAFALKGILVYFSARKDYIGFYPTSSGIAAFAAELSPYKGTKGAVHFPINQPLPLALIAKIVRFRVAENLQKAKAKTRRA